MKAQVQPIAGTYFKSLFLLSILSCSVSLFGQDLKDKISSGNIHGNFQINSQYYLKDTAIGAQFVPEKLLSDGFANVIYNNGNFEAGLRYESYQHVRLGFPSGYKGNGIPYRYVTYRDDKLLITAGNFYEQFGSGLILRAYRAAGIGFDNVFDGFRVHYKPFRGLRLKGLVGKQRQFFELGDGIVRAFDGELTLDEFLGLKNSKTHVILGGSFVSKYQEDKNTQYNLPENVGAWSYRANLMRGGFNLMAEYVYKIPDPSNDNGFIFKDGQAALIQASYFQKGLGISFGAKRIENMSFRSDRNAGLTQVMINYLPPLTKQQTYTAISTLYPYATQPNGEVGFQGELVYKLKKKTKLGGKYGTTVIINCSSANNIDTIGLDDDLTTRKGYKSNYFGVGESYFKDFNVEITKKLSKKVKFKATYANMAFNKDVIQGKSGYNTIYIDAGIMDVTYKINKKHAVRTELQGLWTKHHNDYGDWAVVVIDYTFSPHFGFAVMDQYNYGNKHVEKRLHYPFATFSYTQGATKFMISYGRQRAGLFCVGGVCRVVPSSNGLSLTLTHSF